MGGGVGQLPHVGGLVGQLPQLRPPSQQDDLPPFDPPALPALPDPQLSQVGDVSQVGGFSQLLLLGDSQLSSLISGVALQLLLLGDSQLSSLILGVALQLLLLGGLVDSQLPSLTSGLLQVSLGLGDSQLFSGAGSVQPSDNARPEPHSGGELHSGFCQSSVDQSLVASLEDFPRPLCRIENDEVCNQWSVRTRLSTIYYMQYTPE